MANIIYLNGTYVHQKNAYTHINDRGYQFSDAAYEVILFVKNKPIDQTLHLDRLDRTLSLLKIKTNMSRNALIINIKTLLAKNNVTTAMVYIQISRGVAPRNHAFQAQKLTPTVVMTVKPLSYQNLLAQKNKSLSLMCLPDNRWGRCDLKTTSLLPNILAMDDAVAQGFDDALFYDEKGITEGTSWNFWIIRQDGILQTRPLENTILWGITRQRICIFAKELELKIVEAPITIGDLKNAEAAFATSATKMVMAVHKVGQDTFDTQHKLINKLQDAYLNFIQ